MSSNSKTTEEQQFLLCGWCGKDNINKSVITDGTSFSKSCVCCKKQCYNHKNCAKFYVKQGVRKKDPEYNNPVSIEVFDQCRFPYYCQECMVQECFVCKKKHTQSKLCNLYIYFISHKYLIIS